MIARSQSFLARGAQTGNTQDQNIQIQTVQVQTTRLQDRSRAAQIEEHRVETPTIESLRLEHAQDVGERFESSKCHTAYGKLEELTDLQEQFRDMGCPINPSRNRYGHTGHRRKLNREEKIYGSAANFTGSQKPMFRLRYTASNRLRSRSSSSRAIANFLKDESSNRPNAVDSHGEYHGATSTATDGPVRANIRRKLHAKFRPRFVDIKPSNGPADHEFYRLCGAGMTYLQSLSGKERLDNFRNQRRLSDEEIIEQLGVSVDIRRRRDHTSIRYCQLWNGIAQAVVGPKYKNLCHWVGLPYAMEDTEKPEIGPSLVVLKNGRQTVFDPIRKVAIYRMTEVASVGKGNLDRSFDMDIEKSVLQMFEYSAQLVAKNPITGPVFSFTWNGCRIRYWIVTPDSFSSSRLIDVNQEQHQLDLVKMVMFLCGPVEQVLPSWQPPSIMRVSRPGGNEHTEELAWEYDGTDSLIHSRGGLLDRVSVWKGFADSEMKSAVIKANWLDPALARQQFKILCLLQCDDPLTQFPDAGPTSEAQRLDLIEKTSWLSDVKSRVSKPLAYADTKDPRDWLHAPKRPDLAHDDPRFPPKILAVLLTDGPADTAISKIKELDLKQFLGYFIDLIAELCYTSCHGVHHRDPNRGNMAVRQTSNGLRGCYIDHGNAAYAGERRRMATDLQDHKDACEEDARSANVLFMCLDSLVGQDLLTSLNKFEAHLQEALRDPELGQDEVDFDRANVEKAREAIKAHFLHRYISDLESLLYWFCYELGYRIHLDANPAKQLADKEFKTRAWLTGLRGMMNKMIIGHKAEGELSIVRQMVYDLAKAIQLARTSLGQTDRAALKPALTKVEKDCFFQCYDIASKAKSSLRKKPTPITPIKVK